MAMSNYYFLSDDASCMHMSTELRTHALTLSYTGKSSSLTMAANFLWRLLRVPLKDMAKHNERVMLREKQCAHHHTLSNPWRILPRLHLHAATSHVRQGPNAESTSALNILSGLPSTFEDLRHMSTKPPPYQIIKSNKHNGDNYADPPTPLLPSIHTHRAPPPSIPRPNIHPPRPTPPLHLPPARPSTKFLGVHDPETLQILRNIIIIHAIQRMEPCDAIHNPRTAGRQPSDPNPVAEAGSGT